MVCTGCLACGLGESIGATDI